MPHSQVDPVTPAGPTLPLNRVLDSEFASMQDDTIDLSTPAKDAAKEYVEEGRPVARPLASLKQLLAASAAVARKHGTKKRGMDGSESSSSCKRRASVDGNDMPMQDAIMDEANNDVAAGEAPKDGARASKDGAKASEDGTVKASEDGTVKASKDGARASKDGARASQDGAADSDEQLNDKPLTRRQQLALLPEPKPKAKAKGKASAKSKNKPGPEPKPKAKGKAKPVPAADDDMDGGRPDGGDGPCEEKAAPSRPSGSRGRGKGRGRGRGRGSIEPEADVVAPNHMDASGEDIPSTRLRASAITTPQEVMDQLQSSDLLMRIVLEMLEASDGANIATKDEPDLLPVYDNWQLSVYWTRNAVGVLRKVPEGKPRYCGSFGSGGFEDLRVPLEAVDQFVP